MKQDGKKGFTLMELLIVISLIAILLVAVIVVLNPWQQINKARDARRKHDLNILQKTFEDYYNDKGCYPLPEHVCFDAATATPICSISKTVTSKICHICGSEPNPSRFAEFSSYLATLPCDPEHPRKDYLYEVQARGTWNNAGCQASANALGSNYCPQWYRIYADFSTTFDFDSTTLGCQGGGCGSSKTNPPYGYDYGVASHQVGLEKTDTYWCINKAEGRCNSCGDSFSKCVSKGVCISQDKIYSNSAACCDANPSAPGC